MLLVSVSIAFLGAGCGRNSEVEGVRTSQPMTTDAQKAGVTEDQLSAIIKTAERFTERFGTYTNDPNYQNLDNLKRYATPQMQNWMDNYIHEQEKEFQEKNLAFYGITTTTLISKILESHPDMIRILTNTKREEITDQTETSRVIYQNIIVEMVRVDDDWKVNFAEFQDTQ